MSDITKCCYNCPDREYKCHSKCERYLEFKKYMNERNKKKNEENDRISFMFAVSKRKVKMARNK